MTEQQQTLANAIESQKKLIGEINELNNSVAVRKETALKLQGVIEYLTSTGVTLPASENPELESTVEVEDA